eukprot:6842047-Pyramimonas_sp.AAC.1
MAGGRRGTVGWGHSRRGTVDRGTPDGRRSEGDHRMRTHSRRGTVGGEPSDGGCLGTPDAH